MAQQIQNNPIYGAVELLKTHGVGETAQNPAWDVAAESAAGPGPAGIPDVGGELNFSGNLPGCNSPGEIQEILMKNGFETY